MPARWSRGVVAVTLVFAGGPLFAQTGTVPPPTKLWAAQTAINQITLVWKLSPGASGYVLYRDASGSAGSSPTDGHTKVATLAANASRYVYVVRGDSPQPYQFFLEATDASGAASAKAAFNSVTIVTTPVAAIPPASVSAREVSPGVIAVTWTPSAGATAYTLGRVAGPSGLAVLCALCSTNPTYVDSGVTNGVRYQYSVAAITPTAVSLRTMSNVLTPGVVATGGGTTGSGGTGTGGTGTGGTGTGGTGTGTTGDTSRTSTTTNPLRGRYRVTLTGFNVVSQTYDHPLQIDGKGDEVYLATQVMAFDTANANLVVSNEVRTSRVYGDINGFSYRVKAGTAGSTGGLATGNAFPVAGTTSKDAVGDLPMVLWEGELVQGRNAVVIVPTIWEWDDNPELFGNWLTGRYAMLTRLLQPEPVAAILLNRDPQPMELGAGGLIMQTNMFGDARDRPIGLSPGQSGKDAGFYAPLPLDPKSGLLTTTYVSHSSSIVQSILAFSEFVPGARTLIEQLFYDPPLFPKALGGTNARIPLPSAASAPALLRPVFDRIRLQVDQVMRTQPGIAIRQFATVLSMAARYDQTMNLHLFERMVVLTPQSIQTALSQSKLTASAVIDFQYVDYASLQGKYTLHLKVERLP